MFNILLVDDEELALASLRYALPWNAFGFTDIRTMTSSPDALELLKKERFDACFIDIRMPGLSGLELVDAAHRCGLETLFVVVSGYSDFAYAKQAIQFGVLDYCLKPVAEEDCIPVLEKLSGRILSSRLSHDPLYVARLLSEPDLCRDFLAGLTADSRRDPLTLLLIRTSSLWETLLSADRLLPSKGFLLGEKEALLIWKDASAEDELAAFLEGAGEDAFYIYASSPPSVTPFQNTLKRLRITCHAQDAPSVGIVKLPSVNQDTAAYFSTILSYMEEHYPEHLTLQELAHKFGINYSYLSQLFKKTIHLTFAEHLTNIRLTRACELLSDTYMPITDISEKVGFNDYHYFCNTFKRFYSMTPSQYRNVSRKETKA